MGWHSGSATEATVATSFPLFPATSPGLLSHLPWVDLRPLCLNPRASPEHALEHVQARMGMGSWPRPHPRPWGQEVSPHPGYGRLAWTAVL